jgi:hypothetical protein
MSAHEVTGWRDEEISRRHRMYGMNVPAVDVDFALVEYDMSEPKLIVDYKRGLGRDVQLDASLRALGRLYSATGAQLPAYVVRYELGPWRFTVTPVNVAAMVQATELGVDVHPHVMAEADYVERLLYGARGRQLGKVDRLRLAQLAGGAA